MERCLRLFSLQSLPMCFMICVFQEGQEVTENLNEMQCLWFLTETAYAYHRSGSLGECLKKCHQVLRHFDEIWEGQFDFHAYSMRKMTLRAYVQLLKLEDRIYEQRYFFSSAQLAIQVGVDQTPKTLRVHDFSVVLWTYSVEVSAYCLSLFCKYCSHFIHTPRQQFWSTGMDDQLRSLESKSIIKRKSLYHI